VSARPDGRRRRAAGRPLAALAPLVALACVVVPAAPGAARPTPAARPAQAQPGAYDLDPQTRAAFDHIFDAVPSASCMSVRVNGGLLYARDPDKPVVPASTEKLVTAAIALDVLGADHRFATTVTGAAPLDGVVRGDLTLVGGGDPLLSTDAVIAHREIAEYHPTSLDDLADRLVAAGIGRVEGRVVGDESRYDAVRSVPSWPERFVDQEQSGPLSALGVDDGYDWDLGEGRAVRRRSEDPAASAARHLVRLLEARGITVAGGAASGPGAAGETLAEVRSAPLGKIVEELLTTSDNQTAELLTKELGVHAGAGGSTEAGVGVIRSRAGQLGLTSPGTVIVDGSGLDPTNRATCDQLVRVLDHAGGPDSQIGRGLAVAGETGTLRHRFEDSPVKGRLRAKTGRLNGVSSLAGFVPLGSGQSATFSFVVNDADDEKIAQFAQELFAGVLTGTDLPCDDVGAPLVVPGATYAAPMGTLGMLPLQTLLVPSMVLPLQVFQDRYDTMVDACLAADGDFGIVLVGGPLGGPLDRAEPDPSPEPTVHRPAGPTAILAPRRLDR